MLAHEFTHPTKILYMITLLEHGKGITVEAVDSNSFRNSRAIQDREVISTVWIFRDEPDKVYTDFYLKLKIFGENVMNM